MAYEGKFYLKSVSAATLTTSGSTVPVVAKIIPPYCRVERYWVHNWLTTDKQQFYEMQHYRVSGLYGTLPNNLDQTENLQDIDMDTMIQRYLPERQMDPDSGEAEYADADDDDLESAIELPGGHDRSEASKAQLVFHHEKMLGIPRNGIVVDSSNNITQVDEFTRKGAMRRRHKQYPLEQGKIFAVVGSSNVPQTTDDHGDVMWGDYSNLGELSESLRMLIDENKRDARYTVGDQTMQGYALEKWLEYGFAEDGGFNSKTCWVKTQLTLQVNVYSPHGSNIIAAP